MSIFLTAWANFSSLGNYENIVLQPHPTSDPNQPLNWSQWRKYLNFGLACLYVVMIAALTTAGTPTWGPMQTDLGFTAQQLNNSYALGCGALCVGAFFMIPFALKFGRRPVYIFSSLALLAISIWSANINTLGDLYGVGFMNCFVGVLSEVLLQITVADLFFVHERGAMNTYFIWAVNSGCYLAPLAAGYICTSQGWRWVWWWITIFWAVTLMVMIFLYEETSYLTEDSSVLINGVQIAPPTPEVISEKDAAEITTTKPEKINVAKIGLEDAKPEAIPYQRVPIDYSIPTKTYWQKLSFWTSAPGSFVAFVRHGFDPLLILFSFPSILYMSILYGTMTTAQTVIVTSLSTYMYLPPYNFNASQIGLMSLAPFIGTSLGVFITGPLSDWSILYLSKRNKGIYEPEMRLWLICFFIPFIPAGLFMFGISMGAGASWVLVAMGYGLCCFGIVPPSSIALTYITDAYIEIVADALVGVTFIRSIFATIFVFALTPWIAGMGMQNVFIIIGVLTTAVLLINFYFIYFGKKLRYKTANRYRYYTSRQYHARGR